MLPVLEEIKRRRNILGLTQPQLAKLAGVSQSLIAKLEAGRIDPSYGNMRKIINALEEKEYDKKTVASAKDIHTSKVIGVNNHDTILKASQVMSKNGYSQLPVYDSDKVVGSISEEAINKYFSEGKDLELLSKKQLSDLMELEFPKVDESYPIGPITSLLRHSHAVLTTRKGEIVGIITRADLHKLIKGKY